MFPPNSVSLIPLGIDPPRQVTLGKPFSIEILTPRAFLSRVAGMC